MSPNPPIKSGAELDWNMVRRAALDILKQCDNVSYVPPEAVDAHVMHVQRVCLAMNAIEDGLKLRHA